MRSASISRLIWSDRQIVHDLEKTQQLKKLTALKAAVEPKETRKQQDCTVVD